MNSFHANPRMLVLIVIFFASFDEVCAQIMMDAYRQMEKEGLV